MNKKTAIYALTTQGAKLGKHLAEKLNGDLFLPKRLSEIHGGIPFDLLKEAVSEHFFIYPQLIFIAAAGIVVRAIATYLRSKDRDPAIVVLDQEGRYVISLLSGHLGGANELADQIARLTGGQAVITTATDVAGVPSMDMLAKAHHLAIQNLDAVKSVNMALLDGVSIQVHDPDNRLKLNEDNAEGISFRSIQDSEDWAPGEPGVWVTWRIKEPDPAQLVLHPRCLIAGIGCNRGTDSREIMDLILDTFEQNTFSKQSLKCLTSIDAKQDEIGIKQVSQELDVPALFYSRSDIETVEVPNPSGTVKKHMGVSSVCEATALLKSKGGRLLVPKTKSKNATLAIALENSSS